MFLFIILSAVVFSDACVDTTPPADFGVSSCSAAVTLLPDCSRDDLLEACPLTCGECDCDDSVCHHGTTEDINNTDGCVCDCDANWTGDLCDTVRACNRDQDCNGAGETSDPDSTDGCVCSCDEGFTGENCEFSPPSQVPSVAPVGSTPQPTCSDAFLSKEDEIGSEYIAYNLEKTGFDYESNVFELVVNIPTQMAPSSWSFPNSYVPTITANIDSCLDEYLIEFPWNDWIGGIGEFSNTTNQACSTLTLATIEDFNGHQRDLSYEMPYCLEFETQMELSADLTINVQEPNFLHIMTYFATTHPDFYNGNSEVVFQFTTQVAYPWTVSDTIAVTQFSGLVSGTESLTGGTVTCDGRLYCWKDWVLTFRVDEICVRLLDFQFSMEATYKEYVKTFTVDSQIHTEASCASVIDNLDDDLTADFNLYEDSTLQNEMYRFHINHVVYGQIDINDNLATIDTVSFTRFELFQESNTALNLPYTILTNSGGIITFSMEIPSPPAQGSIGGISSRLEIDLEIAYARRRLLGEEEQTENNQITLEKRILMYLNSCTYPFAVSGSHSFIPCDDGTTGIHICKNGEWIELQSCVVEEDQDKNIENDLVEIHIISEDKNSKNEENSNLPWVIVCFCLITFLGLAASYFVYSRCFTSPQVIKAGDISYHK